MRASRWLALALAFGSLFPGTISVVAQADVSASGAANSAENLMSTLGQLTIPILLDMNCPRDGKNKKTFIHALSAKNSAQESVEALVNASIAFMDKTRTRIGHGEINESQEDATAYRADADNLKQLMSKVAQTGGLDYTHVQIGYKKDSIMEKILSDTSFLYIHHVLNPDAGKSEYVSQRIGELSNNQPQPMNEARNQALLDKILDEFSIERAEGDAIKAILVKGLANLRRPDGQPDVTLQKTYGHQNAEEIHRLMYPGLNEDINRRGTYASTPSPVAQSAHPETSSELHNFEDAEAQRAQILQEEARICSSTAR